MWAGLIVLSIHCNFNIHLLFLATEDEITHGIFNCKTDPNNKCLWFKRTFTDLYDQWVGGADTAALTQHSDIVPGRRGGLEFDSESLKSLNYLKEARMTAKYIG